MNIYEMVEQASRSNNYWLEHFAALVEAAARADEREACAKECERMMMYPNAKQESAAHQNVWAAAKAIRARGTT